MALVKVGSLNDLAVGEMKKFQTEEMDIAVYRLEDGYYATTDLCSHAVASLTEGQLNGDIVTCPRHGGQFNVRTGKAIRFPAFASIETYAVQIEKDEVYVEVDIED